MAKTPLSWNCTPQNGTCINCQLTGDVHSINRISGAVEKKDDAVKIYKFVEHIGTLCKKCLVNIIGSQKP